MFDNIWQFSSFGQFYIWYSLDSNIVLQCGYCEQFGKLFSFTVWTVLDSLYSFWQFLTVLQCLTVFDSLKIFISWNSLDSLDNFGYYEQFGEFWTVLQWLIVFDSLKIFISWNSLDNLESIDCLAARRTQ